MEREARPALSKTSARVLVLTAHSAGRLSELLQTHCTVEWSPDPAAALEAICALRPTLLIVGDDAAAMSQARQLRRAARVPMVLVTGERSPEAIEQQLKQSEADAVLRRPFDAAAVAEAVTAALGFGPKRASQPDEARRDRQRAARKAERDRWARIALLPLGQLLALEHPLKDAEEGLTSLLRRIGQHDFQKEPVRTAAAALDLCLVTILWDLRLAQFSDRSEGDLWERTAAALEHTGFKKEAAALRRSIHLLQAHGKIAEPWDRFEARSGLEGAARRRWEQLATTVDAAAWQPASVRKLLVHARTHLKKLSRIDARG